MFPEDSYGTCAACQGHGFLSDFCKPPMTFSECEVKHLGRISYHPRNQSWQFAGLRINVAGDRNESETNHSDTSTCTFNSSSSSWESVSVSVMPGCFTPS